MGRRVAVALVVGSFLMAGSPGPASAHDVALTPSVSRTKVPKGALDRGDLVVVIGRVRTSDPTCFAGVTVELVRVIKNVGERVLQVKTTSAEGEYWFKRRVGKDQRWYVRFPGFQTVVTGHSHTCGADASRLVKIRIRSG